MMVTKLLKMKEKMDLGQKNARKSIRRCASITCKIYCYNTKKTFFLLQKIAKNVGHHFPHFVSFCLFWWKDLQVTDIYVNYVDQTKKTESELSVKLKMNIDFEADDAQICKGGKFQKNEP